MSNSEGDWSLDYDEIRLATEDERKEYKECPLYRKPVTEEEIEAENESIQRCLDIVESASKYMDEK